MRLTCPNCGSPVEPQHRFCPACGHRLESGSVEERRLVTAVFIDLVGSTSYGERLDPEVLRLVLNRYFEAVSTTIEKWGGSVAKYVGDAVVGVFGLPRSLGDDADRALFAILEANARLEDLNDSLEGDHGLRLQIRSGVETGEVVASSVDEVVLGDVMNTAARLQQMAEPGATLVGSRTVELLTRSFDLELMPPIEARGKTDLVAHYRLLGESPEPAHREVELVGRREELSYLQELLDMAHDEGRPRLVTVVGEAGIGKSALTSTFLESVSPTTALTLWAACLPYGEGFSSWPMRQLLDQVTGREASSDPVRLRKQLADLASDLDESGRVADALTLSAGVALDDNPLHRLPIEARQRELVHAWSALLSNYALKGSLVVVFEDLHWAEPDLLTLIARLAQEAAGPIIFVGTARPESGVERHFESLGHHDSVLLEPLANHDLLGLAERLLPGMSSSQAQRVLAPARGNPFFMEELVAHLVQTGVVRIRDGRHELDDRTREDTIPDTIRSLLGARIDGLSEKSKTALLAGSVFGLTFYSEPLATIVDQVHLQATLEDLERAALIVPSHEEGLGSGAYDFRHDLLREVAYAALPRSRAARYHLSVAEWLEAQVEEARDIYADAIAHHLAAAAEGRLLAWPSDRERGEEIRSRAVAELIRAASLLLDRSQWSDAMRLIERAEGLASVGEEANSVALAKARSLRAADHFDEAFGVYRDLVERCSVDSSGGIRTDALIEGVVMVAQMGGGISDDVDWKDWLAAVVDAELDRARNSNSLEEVAALRMAQGSHLVWRISDMTADEAQEAALEAFQLADQVGSMRIKAPAMDLLAGFGLVGKGIGPAARLIDQVIEVADEAPDRVVANELYTTAQWLLVASGDLERAEEVGSRHLEEARLLGTHTQIHAHRGAVELGLGRGDLRAVLDATEDLLDLVDDDGGKVCDHGGVALSGRALALTEAGRADGRDLFARFAELANPSALFAAQFGNLERWRPFLTIEQADRELNNLGPPTTVYQKAARCWIVLPLAATARDAELLGRELEEAQHLSTMTGDEALGVIVDWGRAVAALLAGDPSAEAEIHRVVNELIERGRVYTAWRLAADAVGLMDDRPSWSDELARAAETGGARATASELRGKR